MLKTSDFVFDRTDEGRVIHCLAALPRLRQPQIAIDSARNAQTQTHFVGFAAFARGIDDTRPAGR
ncbi:MAG: hypothetical protein AAGC76_03915 [Luteibacter sp.]|uniref:hypothetical protein n=1 Tax=Luteibacter sp. TaxID=1886636 RepID=UPI002808B8BF|nr:hypothetical protein [Luteibacter sp.]MDQ7994981.1 hypothetical protein [Luteibacter sp.]MDQ8047503.1 hypothetical protein [Luteibacter sp.]